LKINSTDIEENVNIYEEKEVNLNFENIVFDDINNIQLEIGKNKKYKTTKFSELKNIISKEFNIRFES
jgi:hypothetical protein